MIRDSRVALAELPGPPLTALLVGATVRIRVSRSVVPALYPNLLTCTRATRTMSSGCFHATQAGMPARFAIRAGQVPALPLTDDACPSQGAVAREAAVVW